MKLQIETMRNIHRAHLQHGIPIVDLLTWTFIITGGDQKYIRLSGHDHIYDLMYGSDDVVRYLNRLHIGIYGMRSSFARHLGFTGSPLELSKPEIAVRYFAAYLALQNPMYRETAKVIDWISQACIIPPGFDEVNYHQERVKVDRMSLII